MTGKRFLTILTIFVFFCKCSLGLQCYEQTADFATACTQLYKGVTDGGRCFFLGNKKVNWYNAWQLCISQGGTFAQIHTSSEFSKVVKNVNGQWIWLAGGRDPSVTRREWFLDLQKSRWYTSASQYDQNFTAGNTWIRTRLNDNKFASNANCIHIWWGKFGDYDCNTELFPVCVITNLKQSYSLFSNTCMNEQVMDSYPSTTGIDCAQNCAAIGWCRSFNFWKDTSRCDLFTWSARDGPNMIIKADCLHYTYDV